MCLLEEGEIPLFSRGLGRLPMRGGVWEKAGISSRGGMPRAPRLLLKLLLLPGSRGSVVERRPMN